MQQIQKKIITGVKNESQLLLSDMSKKTYANGTYHKSINLDVDKGNKMPCEVV